ncbi:MAG: hypothetical protein ACK46X_02975 [Candidatus Sericytochromatia bacterium]
MWGLNFPSKKPTQPAPAAEAASCPTQPCSTCRTPMPIVSFDQRCPRCRTLMPASRSCPGACSGCEMGDQ